MYRQSLFLALVLMLAGQSWGSEAEPPAFVQEPADQQMEAGQWAYFWSNANGSPPLLYQWRFNGQNLPGQTFSYLSRYLTSTNMAGNYQVVVSNAAGAVTSRVAVLTVTVRPPQITQQPESQMVDRGDAFTLYVEATGTPPIFLQWRHNDQAVPGAVGSSLPVSRVSSSQAGRYQVVVSNSVGAVTSEVATVTVLFRAPQIVREPESRIVNAGDWTHFDVEAIGAIPFFVQWRFNGLDIPGAIDLQYSPRTDSSESAGDYQVVVGNIFGAVTSAVARLTVLVHPPTIMQQPVSQFVDVGAHVSLGVTVSGSPPFAFQWQREGQNLPGENNAWLNFDSMKANQDGNYRVVVSNAFGVITSAVARLTVTARPPTFSQQPVSRSVNAGDYVSLSVSAAGSPPLSFQWRFNSQDIAGATGSYLYRSPVSINDAGSYRAVVSNPFGTITSSVATLTVLVHPPSISYPPQSETVDLGTSVSLHVGVAGTYPLFMQWQKNSSNIAGETNTFLSLNLVSLDHEGAYRVIVTNAYGAVTSDVATLTVLMRGPQIVQQPWDQTADIGDWISFSTAAEGALPLSYQWRFNGLEMPGLTNPSWGRYLVGTSEAGNYDVVVSNPFGAVTSAVARLTMRADPPTITWNPEDVSAEWGTSVSLSVDASGSLPLSFQWQKDFTNIPGANDSYLWLNALTTNHAGHYRMVVSNAFGMATSEVATVAVTVHPPYIIQQPGDQIWSAGQSGYLTVSAVGAQPLYYQWQFNGQNIPGAKDYLLERTPSWTNDAGDYRVVVSNWVGVVTSDVARVMVRVFPPGITRPPQSQTVDWGTTAYFSVEIYGSPPISLQWMRHGQNLPGATNSWLTLTDVTTNAAGDYQLVARNPLGAATSSVARLTVMVRAPLITRNPADQVVDAGSYFQFSADAIGAKPLFYQWQFKGQNIPGATGNYLQRIANWTNDAGDYRVVVSNWVGVVTSAVARLNVRIYPPSIYQQPQSYLADWGEETWFSVGAGGSPVLTFQWQRDGLDLADATNSDLNIPSASTNDAGSYQVVVSNALGVVTSAVAALTVQIRPPQITYQPVDWIVDAGNWFQFAVEAVGARPLSYQWQFNGQSIPGATSANLSGTANWTNDSGDYRVIVSNFAGVVTSTLARLTVLVHPPAITQQPENKSVDWGNSVSFSAGASGSEPLRYQWQRNGRNIAGSDWSQLSLSSVTTNHAGDYRVVVSNPLGKATSAVARLTVLMRAPQIVTQPQDATVDAGDLWRASVEAIGAQPFSYQWQFNGRDLPDEAYSQIYVYEVATNHAGNYQVVVSNFLGVVTSEVAHLTVLQHPPEIYLQPAGRDVDVESSFCLHVGVRGTPPLHLQWQHDDVNLTGDTNSYLCRNTTATSDAGSYRVVVSNSLGVVTSEVATLTVVLRPPVITQQPNDVVADAGSPAYFDVSADGAPRPVFQWQHEGQNIPPATNSYPFLPPSGFHAHLFLPSVNSNDSGSYRVIFSNYLGVATSAVATLTVRYRPPEFLSQPSSLSVWAGNWADFYCSVAGGPRPRLQWYFNGVPLAGQTNNYLQFAVHTTNQAGFYDVVASNVFGAVTSVVAELTVTVSPPNINLHPVSHGIAVGSSVSFLVSAYGDPPPSLQWQHNGQDIPHATNEMLTLDEVTTNDAGSYRVVARNEAGEAVSREAILTIAARGPLDRWEWRNPLPQGNDLRSVAHGNGVLVAVGSRGARIRSQDGGATWQDCSSDDTDLDAVVFGNGVFVGLHTGWQPSAARFVLSSLDGLEWSKHAIDIQPYEAVASVAFGNGRFVAVTDHGASLVSTNGTNWTRSPEQSPQEFTGLCFGNGLFVATLTSWSFYGSGLEIATSDDGVTWTSKATSLVERAEGMVFGNGRFLIFLGGYYGGSDAAFVSDDAIEWTRQELNRYLLAGPVAYGAGRFLMFGDYYSGLGFISLDGTNWTEAMTGPSNSVSGLHFDGTRFVAVGNQGAIHTSTNGDYWMTRSPGSTLKLDCAAYGNNRYVAVGDGGLVRTSSDGRTWTRRQAPTSVDLRGVAFGNGRFVAVGDVSEEFQAAVLVSEDGVTWARLRADVFSDLHGITFGNGRFVAVGEDGVIAASADGLAWTLQYSANGERLNAITCGGGKFVAVGDRRSIVTSTGNGLWVTRDSPTNSSLRGVAWGNDLFVAGGQSGFTVVSADGENWFEIPALAWPSGGPDIEHIQFTSGTFVAAGANGFLATTTDATLWIEHRTGCKHSLRSTVHAGGYVTAVGDNDTILESDFFGPPILKVRAMRHGGGFEFSVDGETGRSCRLQASKDLVNWEDVFLFTNTHTTTLFLDPDGDQAPHRFYRVISP